MRVRRFLFGLALIATMLGVINLYIPAPKTPLGMLYHGISEEMWRHRPRGAEPDPLLYVLIRNEDWRERFEENLPFWLELEPFEMRVGDEEIILPSDRTVEVVQIVGWETEGIVVVLNKGLSALQQQYTEKGFRITNAIHWMGGSNFYSLPNSFSRKIHAVPGQAPIPRSPYSPWIPLRSIGRYSMSR